MKGCVVVGEQSGLMCALSVAKLMCKVFKGSFWSA